MRGEYTIGVDLGITTLGSPPHARGILWVLRYPQTAVGITPACAGNTTFAGLTAGESGDHPRMRGEYFTATGDIVANLGSPPHARGIRNWQRGINLKAGITPACAGNTLTAEFTCEPFWDHPRMRGEYTKNSL